METKFFNDDFTLDLTKQKMNLQENNSRFNDKSFTKFTFPFDAYIEDQFVHYVGDYMSYENTGLQNVILGIFLHENKLSEAKLTILSIQGAKLTGQIDYGYEDIPNYDKKLSDLPLAQFDVDDIHTYAKNICAKNYPEVNFNFPRMFTKKYSPDDELWDAFDGYYNDLKPDGSEMRRNYLDADLNIFNLNIIHPCPHILYLLKTGFADKGLTLKGDILNDQDLAQRWVFSGTDYFVRYSQAKSGLRIESNDYDTNWGFGSVMYLKALEIKKKGSYKIMGFFKCKNIKGTNTGIIQLNTNKIWSFNSYTYDETTHSFSIDINVPEDNSILFFQLHSVYNISNSSPVISVDLINKTLTEPEEGGEESGVVTNLNRIDLTRAVPDMLFGELVNKIKNWLNYELDVVGKDIYMNKLNKDPSNIKSFEQYEVSEPKRTLLNQRSFLIKFEDLDDEVKQNSMYYDAQGNKLNGEPQTDTTTIEIDGYAMPVELAKPNGYTTAIVKKDSTTTLALVYYDGLTGVQNNAKNPPGLAFPELWDKNWYKFLRQRVFGSKYEDSFLAYIEDISNYTIKDYLFWNNNVHQVTNWGKEMLTEHVYKLTITTETIV